jgi:hypothetical protein
VVVVAVAFSVDLEGTFDELCRRVDMSGDMRDELRASGLDNDSERITVDSWCLEGLLVDVAEIRVVKCRQPMACTLPRMEHCPRLVRNTELPSPTLMASITTEYVASRYLALPRVIDLMYVSSLV